MKIRFKSNPENWRKEYLGLKCNTVRKIQEKEEDIRKEILLDWIHKRWNILHIEIENTVTTEVFVRTVTDVTYWEGNYIISWEHKK